MRAIVTTTGRKHLKLLRAERAPADGEIPNCAAWLERAKWGHGPPRRPRAASRRRGQSPAPRAAGVSRSGFTRRRWAMICGSVRRISRVGT